VIGGGTVGAFGGVSLGDNDEDARKFDQVQEPIFGSRCAQNIRPDFDLGVGIGYGEMNMSDGDAGVIRWSELREQGGGGNREQTEPSHARDAITILRPQMARKAWLEKLGRAVDVKVQDRHGGLERRTFAALARFDGALERSGNPSWDRPRRSSPRLRLSGGHKLAAAGLYDQAPGSEKEGPFDEKGRPQINTDKHRLKPLSLSSFYLCSSAFICGQMASHPKISLLFWLTNP
jgi:hypothetical protein